MAAFDLLPFVLLSSPNYWKELCLMPFRLEMLNRIEQIGHSVLDEFRNAGAWQAFYKSRPVVPGFADKTHGILMHVPTVLRVYQCTLICMAPMVPNLKGFVRNVHQAYTQSEILLKRDVFIRPPANLDIPKDYVLRVLLCTPRTTGERSTLVCDLSQSPYRAHEDDSYNPQPRFTFFKSAPLFGNVRNTNQAREITCVRIDDSLSVGNETFMELPPRLAQRFGKPREAGSNTCTVMFNGVRIAMVCGTYIISQPENIERLQWISVNVLQP